MIHQPLTKIHNTFVVYLLLYKQEFYLDINRSEILYLYSSTNDKL
jgi:hypothetical protein